MSQEIINNSDSGLVSKSKINNNFSELYQAHAEQEEFETVAKNLKSYPNTRSYTGARLNSVTYTVPAGAIVKTLNYTGDKLTSVVLSGNTPSGIDLTKTNTWTGDNLTGVAYS